MQVRHGLSIDADDAEPLTGGSTQLDRQHLFEREKPSRSARRAVAIFIAALLSIALALQIQPISTLPPPPPPATDFFWRNTSASAASSAKERLSARLSTMLKPDDYEWSIERGQWTLKHSDGPFIPLAEQLCAALQDALPHAGLNGVFDAALALKLSGNPIANMFPALVNGVAVDDLAHLPGALAIAVAMREARPHQRDAALHSAISLSATANSAAKGAPLRSYLAANRHVHT